MSNEPTKDTDRWNIGKSNIVQNVAFLLLCLTVSNLFNLRFLWAVLWCIPVIPGWWLNETTPKPQSHQLDPHQHRMTYLAYSC